MIEKAFINYQRFKAELQSFINYETLQKEKCLSVSMCSGSKRTNYRTTLEYSKNKDIF